MLFETVDICYNTYYLWLRVIIVRNIVSLSNIFRKPCGGYYEKCCLLYIIRSRNSKVHLYLIDTWMYRLLYIIVSHISVKQLLHVIRRYVAIYNIKQIYIISNTQAIHVIRIYHIVDLLLSNIILPTTRIIPYLHINRTS